MYMLFSLTKSNRCAFGVFTKHFLVLYTAVFLVAVTWYVDGIICRAALCRIFNFRTMLLSRILLLLLRSVRFPTVLGNVRVFLSDTLVDGGKFFFFLLQIFSNEPIDDKSTPSVANLSFFVLGRSVLVRLCRYCLRTQHNYYHRRVPEFRSGRVA